MGEETKPLPRMPSGDLECSAIFGMSWVVEIFWNEDADGRRLDPKTEEFPRSLYGPFFSEEEATEWMHAYPEFTEIDDIIVTTMNSVRPS